MKIFVLISVILSGLSIIIGLLLLGRGKFPMTRSETSATLTWRLVFSAAWFVWGAILLLRVPT